MLSGLLLTWWMMDTADGAEDKTRESKVGAGEKMLTDRQATETETTTEIICETVGPTHGQSTGISFI